MPPGVVSTALVQLATAAAVVPLMLAGLGITLGAAADSPARASSIGRLRSLGTGERQLRAVLSGEVMAPVLASLVAGTALGVTCALATFGSLGLEQVTGQTQPPQLVVSLWAIAAAAALLVIAFVIARREGTRLRHTSLASLLRRVDPS